jgi:hypothetical protein
MPASEVRGMTVVSKDASKGSCETNDAASYLKLVPVTAKTYNLVSTFVWLFEDPQFNFLASLWDVKELP